MHIIADITETDLISLQLCKNLESGSMLHEHIVTGRSMLDIVITHNIYDIYGVGDYFKVTLENIGMLKKKRTFVPQGTT